MRFELDPDAVLDFKEDWSPWLETDETITAATATADDNVHVNSTTHDSTSVTVWVSGGVAGAEARVRIRVTTSAGRRDDRSFTLDVRER